MADGSVIIGVKMNTAQADKDLAKLKKDIQATEDAIGEQEAKKSPLVAEAEQLSRQMKEARAEVDRYRKEWVSGVAGADVQQAKAQERLGQIENKYSGIVQQIDKIDEKLLPAYDKLDRMKQEAGDLAEQLEKAQKNTKKMEKASKKASKHMGVFATRLRGIVLSAFVFNIFSKAFREMTDWMGRVVKSNSEASAAISRLKGELLVMAQPLVDVIVPAFSDLVNILADVVHYAAQVSALLFGTTYEEARDAAAALDEEQKAIDGVGSAAQRAEKNLASFDEINRLTSESSSNTSISLPTFSVSGSGLPDWLTTLILRVKDVLFEWKDLSAEDVLEKIVAGLLTVAGAIIGFSVGGVGGAVLGIVLGASLGMVLSGITFDGDDTLNPEEIVKSIVTALLSIAGGVLGFSVGGVKGAAIGVTAGASLSVYLNSLLFDNDGKMSKEEVLKSVISALGVLVGGVLGFMVGGPAGAAIGVLVGAALTTGISNILFNNDGKLSHAEVVKAVCVALAALVGGVIGFVVGGPVGAVIGITLGATAAVALSDLDFDAIANTKVKRAILDSLVSALYIIAGGVIGFAFGGPAGAILGMVIGATLRIAINEVTFDRTGNISQWGDLDLRGGSVGGGRYSIDTSSIPGLANGAVIPPNREFMAVLGDQKSGTNIETPLDTMVQAFRMALQDMGGGTTTVVVMLDGKEVARNQVKHINDMTRQAGKPVLLY